MTPLPLRGNERLRFLFDGSTTNTLADGVRVYPSWPAIDYSSFPTDPRDSNGLFTAPQDGFYRFHLSLEGQGVQDFRAIIENRSVSPAIDATGQVYGPIVGRFVASVGSTLLLAKGDTVAFAAVQYGQASGASTWTYGDANFLEIEYLGQ